MKSKATAAQIKEYFQTGREIQAPDGRKEIFLSWGKLGAWITSGGLGGKKQFVMKGPLVESNFSS